MYDGMSLTGSLELRVNYRLRAMLLQSRATDIRAEGDSRMESIKQRLTKRAIQAELRHTGGMPETGSFHRRAYHRNFEGYTEIKQLNAQGKLVIQRIYTGKYYEPKLSLFHRLVLRLFYLVFFVGGTALFLYCSTRNVLCNQYFYVNLFQVICIPLLLWCVYVLIFYIPDIGRLTIGDYNTQHKALVAATRTTAFCMWAASATALLCVIASPETETLVNLLCALGFAAGGLLIFAIFLFEDHLEYIVISSAVDVPPGGVEIE